MKRRTISIEDLNDKVAGRLAREAELARIREAKARPGSASSTHRPGRQAAPGSGPSPSAGAASQGRTRLAGRLHVLGLTDGGQPRHPLYMRADTEPVPWS